MADALCGPSNPLQNLQKHTQIDRTLQQDRLVASRQSPSQGFRTHDPRTGSLDADFHAFEHSAPSPFQFQQPDFANAFPAFRPPSQTPALGGWANDFKNLNINEQPVPAQHFRTEAPLVRSSHTGSWHTEFMHQRSSASTPTTVSQGKQAIREPQFNNYTPSSMMNFSQPSFSMYQQNQMLPFQDQQQHQQLNPLSTDHQAQMSDVDFEAAFADALAHAQEMDQANLQNQSQEEPISEVQYPEEKIKIGSDAILYREKDQRTADQDKLDADELARTAGQLLTSVQHDTSTKFQNSSFLDLMRRIRDREVEVQNNDLTNVMTGEAAASSASTTVHTLYHNPETYSQVPSDAQDQNQEEQPSQFAFPDMDTVYAPDPSSPENETSWNTAYPPTTAAPSQAPYTSYAGDDDQHSGPMSQMQALHPGGPFYPEQSPRQRRAEMEMSMSGAIDVGAPMGKRISANDFEYVDENAGLARRFR
ncbi:hypothetical protein PV10_02408 [Exophiala mesophila]|uniref:Peroxin 20 n=1 Tax=Exophiala mesophila TaxID=212818 RepID=A0A0D1ZL41_EXOME|nr:uncharacterized protein PV10_02408 [Exophiala mesophila]KIV94664.1 hypothetical protein PV10_02408 [Exophiala mesophila]